MRVKSSLSSVLMLFAVIVFGYAALPAVSAKVQTPPAASSSTQGSSSRLRANKELVRRFYVAFATGNTAIFSDILTPDWEDIPLAPGQQPGRDGLAAIVQLLRGTFSNLSIVSQDYVAEGDKVAVRMVWSGVHTGDLLGVKGTGKKITLNTTDIHQIANGRIIRTWHLEDMMGVYGQVGGLDGKH